MIYWQCVPGSGQLFQLSHSRWQSHCSFGVQVALEGMKFSEDGSLLAYEVAKAGSDWHSLKLMAIDAASGKGKDLEEELLHIKFNSTAWTHDNKVGRWDSSGRAIRLMCMIRTRSLHSFQHAH